MSPGASTPRIVVVALVVLTALASAVGCSDSGPTTVDYAVDARVDSYNANTVDGNASGVLMALTRVLPGFSYLGAQGQVTPDRDVGTVSVQPGDTLTLRYQFTPTAVFSDGQQLDCDDLVLAWAAMSGRFPGFTPATTAGYRDITAVDCTAGAKTAIVRFAAGRAYRDWPALFGAGTLLPAHVVARTAGIDDVLGPIRRGQAGPLAKVAKAWDTGFRLAPGAIDTARFPSSGPYRMDSYSRTDGLVLVANEKWWGDAPKVPRIVIWGRGTDVDRRLTDGAFDIADVTGGFTEGDITPSGGAATGPTTRWRPRDALGVDEVVLSQRGVFADVRTRRAFASCVPRDALARQFGQGAQMWNMRVLAPADDLAAQINNEFGRDYARPDPNRARGLLDEVAQSGSGEAGTAASVRVRVGFIAPTPRFERMVTAIADSCRAAGITVVPAGGEQITPGALGRSVDALLVSGGAGFAASGALDPARDAYQVRGGDPLDLPDFTNPQVNDAVDQLATVDLGADRLQLVRTIENGAWTDMPSIPLFASPRVQRWNARVANVIPGLARNGTGWNMDRWSIS